MGFAKVQPINFDSLNFFGDCLMDRRDTLKTLGAAAAAVAVIGGRLVALWHRRAAQLR